MRVSPIQESFQSGVLGGRVRGRVQTDAYKKGLAKATNWYPLVQGPIKMRRGSRYKNAVDPDNWVSGLVGVEGIRVFTFQRGLDNDAIVEVGETDIVVRDSVTGEILVGGSTGNLISDPEMLTLMGAPVQSSVWSTVSGENIFGTNPGFPQDDTCTGDISTIGGGGNSVLYMHSNTNHSPSGFYGSTIGNTTAGIITLPAGSELLVNNIDFSYYQRIWANEEVALGAAPWANPVIRVNIGTTKGAADVFTTDIPIGPFQEKVDVNIAFTPGVGNNLLYFTFGTVWPGPAAVPDLNTVGCTDTLMLWFLYNAASTPFSWTAPLAGGSGSSVEFASPYDANQMKCLQYAMDPGEQVAYFMHPEVETMRLRFSGGEWTFEALSAITLPSVFIPPTPNLWVPGNFPSAGVFHEGRLWLAGTPGQPSTLWASRSGNYQDFNQAAPASKDDPMEFPLSSTGNIQTLTSRKELVINTDISEVIGTSVQGVIAFDDFSFPKQTDWGSNCIQPVVVGRDMVFTSNSQQRLRTFSDEGGTNFGWDGKELSLLAQDLFQSPVRRMVYLDEPAYQACFLLADGTMAMATFFYPENVIGWWRYVTAYNGDRASGDTSQPGLGNQFANPTQTTNQIMDITKVNTSQGAKLWMVINRVGYAGTQKPNHELMSFDDTLLAPISLDSWVERDISPVTKTISDIDHLTDQSINAVVKRTDPLTGVISYTVHPNITAIAGVSSPFEDWAAQGGSVAYVGLFFDNEFELLPVEGVSNRGTAQVSKRRWNKVFARLNDSAAPLINGEPPKDRTPATIMGVGEPFLTGDVEYTELGSLNQGQLNVSQDKPLQTEVSALFGKLTSTEV